MNHCTAITRDHLLEMIDGPSGQVALDEHVDLCDRCVGRLEDLRQQRRALRLLAAAESRSTLTGRVLRAARAAGRFRIRELLRRLARACSLDDIHLDLLNDALEDVHVLGRRMAELGEDLETHRLPRSIVQECDLLVAMFVVLEILDAIDVRDQKPTAAPSFRDSLAPR